jgi:hypothetical protein
MAFHESRFERYAMQAEQMSQETPLLGGVEIDAVGQALDFTPEESREIALFLQDIRWGTVSFVGAPRLRLTPFGFREIAKLRRPGWRRWIDRHPLVLTIIASVISGIVVLLGSKCIDAILRAIGW